MLGLPAIAVSQQSTAARDGLPARRPSSSSSPPPRSWRAWSRRSRTSRCRAARCSTSTSRGGEIGGVEVARLGKRIYRDELVLQEEESSRRQYRIYGDAPDYERQEGTDLAAVADGRVAVTPIHFDLTDEPGIETLQAYDLARLLAPAAARSGMSAGGARRRAARPARVPRPPLLRPRRPGDRRRRLRRAARRAARARGRAPGAAHAGLADAAGRRRADLEAGEGRAPAADALARQRPLAPTSCGPGSRACARTWRARGSRTRSSSTSRSRRSTASRSRSSTATACSSAARRAATARSARTSRTTCARSRRSRCGSTTRRRWSRCAARSTWRCRTSRRSTSGAPSRASRRS